jgi:hypothetical protein
MDRYYEKVKGYIKREKRNGNKKNDYLNWTQKKEEADRSSVYFFRNTIH